jgi:ribosomal protein S18 acetylase RimI-like enzyme
MASFQDTSLDPNLKVVKLATKDPPALLAQAKAIALAAFGKESVEFQLAPRSRTELLFNCSFILLNEATQSVLGYGCMKPHHSIKADGNQNEAILHTLCVDEAHRGKGYGGYLASEMCVAARDEFGVNFMLLTPAKENEAALIRLYQRCGFSLMGGNEDVVTMGAKLSNKLENSGTDIGGIADLYRKKAALDGEEEGSKWMRRRLRDRSEPADRKVVSASDFSRAARVAKLDPVALDSRFRATRCVDDMTKYGLMWEPQVGPMCGIAALYVATSMRESIESGGLEGFEIVESSAYTAAGGDSNLLEAAKELGFSTDGEMFDARRMASLCAGSLRTFLSSEFTDERSIVAGIDAGGCFLVAFDVVGNRCGERGGASAHWGLITGYVDGGGGDNDGGLLVYVQHTQNQMPFFTSFADIKASNAQITDPNKKYEHAKDDLFLRGTIIFLIK